MSTGTDPAFFDDDYRRLLAPFYPEADARRETAVVREILALAQDDRVLDLGCGWGRHLTLLADAGHHVTGVDLSVELLRQVPRRSPPAPAGPDAPADPIAPPRRPPLAAADMLALPFQAAAFDAILNLATSLGLFLDDDDALAALREVRRVLRPGGRLLLEGMHRDDIEPNFAPADRWRLDDGTVVRARRRWDARRGISEEVLQWRGPAGEGEKRHALRIRTAAEIGALIQEAGLSVTDQFGGWDRRPFTSTSPTLIALSIRD
jgi:SAM-dependent methyltransferase